MAGKDDRDDSMADKLRRAEARHILQPPLEAAVLRPPADGLVVCRPPSVGSVEYRRVWAWKRPAALDAELDLAAELEAVCTSGSSCSPDPSRSGIGSQSPPVRGRHAPVLV